MNARFVLTNIAVSLCSYCLSDVIQDPTGKGEPARIVVSEQYLAYVRKYREKKIYLRFKVTIQTFYRREALLSICTPVLEGGGGGSSFPLSSYLRHFNN